MPKSKPPKQETFLSLSFFRAFGGSLGIFFISCLFSLSTSLRAASTAFDSSQAGPAGLGSLKEYQVNMPVIQEMMKMACANQQLDDARAVIANSTREKSDAILTDLQGDIQRNAQFLSNPTNAVKTEFQSKAQTAAQSAENQLLAAQDKFEYNQRQYQLGDIDKSTLNLNKQAIQNAQTQLSAAQEPLSSELLSQAVRARTNASLTAMKQLQSAAHDVAQASAQAEGCYLSASGSGTPSAVTVDNNGNVITPTPAATPTTEAIPSTGTTATGPSTQGVPSKLYNGAR